MAPTAPRGRITRDSSIQAAHWYGLSSPAFPISVDWQYSTPLNVSGLTQLSLYLYVVRGAADWIEFQILHSFDGTSFLPRDNSGTLVKHVVDATYSKKIMIPILDNYTQIGVRGFGVGGFGTSIFAVDAIAGDSAFSDDLLSGKSESPSLVLAYDIMDNLIQVDKTEGGSTWRKTLTWTGTNLTAISAWVLL